MGRSGRLRGVAAGCAGGALLLCGAGIALVRGVSQHPPALQDLPVEGDGDARSPTPGDRLTVLVWNIQYGASRRYHFFYDGGDAVRVAEGDVRETLAAIAAVVAEQDADLVLLQEVDRDSARTHRIDELAELLAAQPYPAWVAAPYHKVAYVPHPPGNHLGRVDMELATLSRLAVSSATRIQLPLLDEPFYRRAFNLRRAVLEVTVPLRGGGPPLVVLNTHLSAFSFGDGTLEAQVRRIEDRLTRLDEAGSPWILGGDLNMLPPGDDPARLADGGSYEAIDENPIAILFDAGRRSAIPVASMLDPAAPVRTYLPFGAEVPDRTLDYLFVSDGVDVLSAEVVDTASQLSDHLPLRVELAIR